MIIINFDQPVQGRSHGYRRPGHNCRTCNQNFLYLHRNDGDQNITLGLEIVVKRADGHFGSLCNILDPHRVIAQLAKQIRRRSQNAFRPVRLLLCPQACHAHPALLLR